MVQSKFILLEADEIQVQSLKVKSELNLKIWDRDDNYRMHADVRRKLLDVADYFVAYCELDKFGLNPPVRDIILTGSLANYNWSVYSDIDVHVIMDFGGIDRTTSEILAAYLELRKKQFSEQHDIRVVSHEVELYVQDGMAGLIALGVYSIMNDKWVRFPKKYEKSVDWEMVKRKSASYIDAIDDAKKAMDFGSVKSNVALLDRLNYMWKKIKSERRAGLEEAGEFAVENLIFKVLRRNGYIQKLLDLRSRLISERLSLKR